MTAKVEVMVLGFVSGHSDSLFVRKEAIRTGWTRGASETPFAKSFRSSCSNGKAKQNCCFGVPR